MEIPKQVGFMVLPNAILFPQALLPLYIFEARYREMLRQCLQEQRVFGIVMPGPDARPREVAGVGLIRACVDNEDGSSNLILQGVSRVRLRTCVQETPYYVAEVEVLETEEGDNRKTKSLAQKVISQVRRLSPPMNDSQQGVVPFLEQLTDYDALADIVTYSFVMDVSARQEILETLNLPQRLQRVLTALEAQAADPDITL
jgi:Lon protease-like protein